jgi:phospholipase C
MRKYFALLSFLLLVAYTLVSAGGPAAMANGGSGGGGSGATTPIEHVVIIYQENHTFDDVLGAVCQTRSNPCNGYTGPVTFADGTQADNIVQPDVIPDIDHTPASQDLALSNQWDQIQGCDTPPYSCVSHVDPANIPNLAALADTFAVSDATFATNDSASFGAHVSLVSGTHDGFAGYNPKKSVTGAKPGVGWGCNSDRDALWGDPGNQSYVPACVPDQNGDGPYRASPVPYAATVMERLEAARLSWHIYQGAPDHKPDNNNFSVCTYFAWCYLDRYKLSYDSATDDFVSDAAHGRLPNLSLILPDDGQSQHNNTSMSKGDNYIGQVVSAVESSPDWDSTAIFITYDDCGCFYDHVTPPAGMGLRNPMVIVSPWAKPGYTDSTPAAQPYSMLAFIQHDFALAPLTDAVSNAYDYMGSFDFGQHPLSGPAMTHTRIPASERAQLARLLPSVQDDDT